MTHRKTLLHAALLLGTLWGGWMAAPASAVELRAALSAAESRDPSLAAARSTRDAAAENVPLTNARLLPQLSFQGSAQRLKQRTTRDSIIGPITDEFAGPSDSMALQLRMGVYRPRDRLGADLGALQAEVGEYSLSTASSELWLRTTQSWLEVLAADTQRLALREAETAAERVQVQARARLLKGDGTRDALAEADAQLAAARAGIRDTEYLLAGRQRNFGLLTGLPGVATDGWRLPEQRMPTLPLRMESEWAQIVLASNAELRASTAAQAINEKKLAQASADHWPTLDVVASASRSRNDAGSSVRNSYEIGMMGVQLSVPLFTGGALTAAERQAAAFVEVARAEREAYAQALRQRVTVLWGNIQGLQEKVVGSVALVEAAKEQLRAAELGLQHGQRSVGDVSAAVALWVNRRRDLADQRVNLLVAQAQLLALLPTGDPAWTAWITELETLARVP